MYTNVRVFTGLHVLAVHIHVALRVLQSTEHDAAVRRVAHGLAVFVLALQRERKLAVLKRAAFQDLDSAQRDAALGFVSIDKDDIRLFPEFSRLSPARFGQACFRQSGQAQCEDHQADQQQPSPQERGKAAPGRCSPAGT